MKKNVASQSIGAQMITAADGTAFTGAVSVLVTIDNGTQTAGGGTAPAHEGNGYHSYSPTQAETNGDHIAFTFTGTGAIPATVQVYTNFPQTGDSYTRLGAPAGASVSADIADVPTVAEFNARTLPSASYFDFSTDQVIVATNNDKTGYSISGTKTTLDALNDIAATQIVSAGAITTSGGAVSTVTTVSTCTTNTDMRGTDNALLASSAPTNFSDLAISVTTGQVTVGTNNDKAGYSISGTKTTLDALNDITSASVWAEATRTLTSGANIVLAKGVGVTGFNDIAATDIVSGGAIITSGGIASADTKKVNGATVLGNGTGANLWRGS